MEAAASDRKGRIGTNVLDNYRLNQGQELHSVERLALYCPMTHRTMVKGRLRQATTRTPYRRKSTVLLCQQQVVHRHNVNLVVRVQETFSRIRRQDQRSRICSVQRQERYA